MANRTYKMSFQLENGETVNAGNFVANEGDKGEKGPTGDTGKSHANVTFITKSGVAPTISANDDIGFNTADSELYTKSAPKGINTKGNKGATGDKGPTGPDGEKGATGADGDQGPVGTTVSQINIALA